MLNVPYKNPFQIQRYEYGVGPKQGFNELYRDVIFTKYLHFNSLGIFRD